MRGQRGRLQVPHPLCCAGVRQCGVWEKDTVHLPGKTYLHGWAVKVTEIGNMLCHSKGGKVSLGQTMCVIWESK